MNILMGWKLPVCAIISKILKKKNSWIELKKSSEKSQKFVLLRKYENFVLNFDDKKMKFKLIW